MPRELTVLSQSLLPARLLYSCRIKSVNLRGTLRTRIKRKNCRRLSNDKIKRRYVYYTDRRRRRRDNIDYDNVILFRFCCRDLFVRVC